MARIAEGFDPHLSPDSVLGTNSANLAQAGGA